MNSLATVKEGNFFRAGRSEKWQFNDRSAVDGKDEGEFWVEEIKELAKKKLISIYLAGIQSHLNCQHSPEPHYILDPDEYIPYYHIRILCSNTDDSSNFSRHFHLHNRLRNCKLNPEGRSNGSRI